MAKYSAEQMRQLGAKGQAFKNPGGDYSFPIADAEDLANAIRAVGRSRPGVSNDAIRKYIIRRAMALGKSSLIPDTWNADGSLKGEGRSELPDWQAEFVRSVTLDDIRIRSGGTGRTVEAYAAIFDEPAEIVDHDGHYLEVNSRSAFNQTIAHHRGRFPVVYHHGMTLAGTPSDRGSVPIGVSTEVTADAKGVLTVSEYGRSQLADEVLESIRLGAVNAQSYGGRFIKSDPRRPVGGRYRASPDGTLKTVTRLEVAMREFGPTPFPAFANAAITGIRAQQVLGALLTAPPDQRAIFLNGLTTPLGPEAPTDTPSGDVELIDEALPKHSARSLQARIRAARIIRGME